MFEESENEIYFNICLLKVAACIYDFFQNQKKVNSVTLTKTVHELCKQVFNKVALQLTQNLSKQLLFTLQQLFAQKFSVE